jgi:hypothetical protein
MEMPLAARRFTDREQLTRRCRSTRRPLGSSSQRACWLAPHQRDRAAVESSGARRQQTVSKRDPVHDACRSAVRPATMLTSDCGRSRGSMSDYDAVRSIRTPAADVTQWQIDRTAQERVLA